VRELDAAGLSRLRSAWLDPEVKLSDLKARFRIATKDYPWLREKFGERPDTNLTGRLRVWKKRPTWRHG